MPPNSQFKICQTFSEGSAKDKRRISEGKSASWHSRVCDEGKSASWHSRVCDEGKSASWHSRVCDEGKSASWRSEYMTKIRGI